MLTLHLLLSLVVRVFYGHLPGACVYHDVHRSLEHRTFLHQVIAKETKMAVLGKHCRFLLHGPILEMVDHAVGNGAAVRGLERIAVRENSSVQRSNHQETSNQAFRLSHCDW